MGKKTVNNIYHKVTNNKYLPYVIIILLGILTTVPLFTMNLSELNEFRIHIGRVTMVKEIIGDGVFPPFISYKHMSTFGYALNIFYGPLTTYIPILISFITTSTTMALKIFTLITVILSGATMYMFTYKITNSKGIGLISALIYMVAPYKFTDIYSRNAVGEYTAFIFIPMVFHGLYELINDDKKGNYWLIAGSSFLIISHTITTIYTALFAIVFLAFNFSKVKKWWFWKNVIIDVIWTFVLTSFYIIPLVEHKLYGNYLIFDADAMGANAQAVYNNTNSVLEWLKNEFANSGNPHEDLIFSFGIIITFFMVITIFAYKKVDEKYRDLYGTFLTMSIITLYMCTKAFPWLAMPHFLTVIQFAWRLNGFFIFFISLVCGINAYELSKMISSNKTNYKKKQTVWVKRKIISAIIVVTIFFIGGFGVTKYIKKYDGNIDKKFEQNMLEAESIGPYYINRDYMPLNAMDNIQYLQSRENKTYVIDGEATIESENKERLKDVIKIESVDNAKVELPYLYYHGYTTKLNGKKLKNYESQTGFIAVEINEAGTLEIKYEGTIIEKCGYVISAIGIILFVSYMFMDLRNNQ